MADLSRIETRPARGRRNISDGVRTEPNTQSPERKFLADMRNARRGDGGADEIRRIFGLVSNAAGDFMDYQAAKQEVKDKESTTEGAYDAIAGDLDPERAERSRAYAKGFYTVQAEKDTLTFTNDLRQRALEKVNDPENPVDPEEFKEWLVGETKAWLKPEGSAQRRDFQVPEALPIVSGHLRRATDEIAHEADKIIRAQTHQRIANDRAEVLRLKLEAGEIPDFEELFKDVPPGVDRGNVKAVGLLTLENYIESIKDTDPKRGEQLFGWLLGSQRTAPPAPPAPSVVQTVAVPASNGASADPVGAPASPGASVASFRAPGAAGEVASVLHGKGWSPVVVAGFLGNLEHESGFRPNGPRGDGGTAYGIAQWRHERVANFQRVMGKPLVSASVEEQAQFIVWEMDNPRAAGMTVKQRDRILSAKTPEEAARFIDQFYERSDGKARSKRETSARSYFAGAAVEGDGEAVAAGPVQALDPAEPSAIDLAQAGPNPFTGSTLKGAYSLNPAERSRLMALRSNYRDYVKQNEEKKTREAQGLNGQLLVSRFLGNGAYPTRSEVREMVRTNQLSSEQG